jgi:drug/metabolite transporter (DMT)-like permease
VAHALTSDEPLSGARLAGVCAGLLGVGLLLAPELSAPGIGQLLPMAACIGAALSYALAGVFGRRFAALGLDPVVVAAGQLTASTALLLPVAATLETPWALAPPGGTTIAAVFALALASTAGAYVIYFRLLAAVGAGNLLFVTQLVPVSAILLGVFVLGEALVPREIGAMVLIAGGLAITDPRVSARLRGRTRSGT